MFYPLGTRNGWSLRQIHSFIQVMLCTKIFKTGLRYGYYPLLLTLDFLISNIRWILKTIFLKETISPFAFIIRIDENKKKKIIPEKKNIKKHLLMKIKDIFSFFVKKLFLYIIY